MDIRQEFLATLPVLRSFIGAAGDRWDDPSALVEMTIGDLAGHTARAVFTTETYIDAPPPDGGSVIDAPGYYLALPELQSALDSEFHRSVRERAHGEAEAGPGELLSRLDRSVDALRTQLGSEDPDRIVGVLGDLRMRLDDYLVTRLIEVVVHSDDLAASLDADAPEFSDAVNDAVIQCLVEVAIRRHSHLAVARALTRRERDVVSALRVL